MEKQIEHIQRAAKELTKAYAPKDNLFQLSPVILTGCSTWNMDCSFYKDSPHEGLELRMAKIELGKLWTFLEFIVALGEEEHSSDWDLGLKITLKDGTIIDTDQGFAQFDINDDVMVIEKGFWNPAEQETEVKVTEIPILKLKEIIIYD